MAELPALESTRYDRNRAAAFAAALEGGADRARTQLKLAGPESAQRLAVDAAVVELLVGDPHAALALLREGLEGVTRVEPDVPAVLAECRRRGGAGIGRTTVIAAKGSPATAAAVMWAAARDQRFDRVVPVLAIAALLVAVLAFGRLPVDTTPQQAAPTLPSRAPVVVVAEQPPTAAQASRDAPPRAGSTSIQIAVRTPAAVASRPVTRRPFARAVTRPQTQRGGPAPAPSPSPAPVPPPPTRTLAAQQAPAAAASAPTPQEPPARRGRAVGHQKKAARAEATAPAPATAPVEATTAAPAAEPGPPPHAQATGHEHAPGQQKKP